jgi:hypothetical protein
MLVKANRFPRGSVASRLARLCAAVAVCAIPPTLAIQAPASAADPVVQTLGTVVHTAGSSVSSTVSTAAAQTGDSLPAQPTTPPAAPAIPAPSAATPAASAAQSPASGPPKTPPVASLSATATPIAAVTRDANERIAGAAASAVSHVEGHEGQGALLHAGAAKGTVAAIVAATVRRDPPVDTAALLVQRAADLHQDTAAILSATQALAQTSGAARIVRTVGQDAPAIAGKVAHIAGAIRGLTRSGPGPGAVVVRPLDDSGPASSPLAGGSARTGGATASTPGSIVGATTAATPTSDRWGIAIATSRSTWSPRFLALLLAGAVTEPPGRQLLPGGQIAVSSPAHGAPPASLPASPAPTPSSPGGVSPATAVGSGGGISLALALIALLMLATPPVQRRLRLLVESWPRAPFVLIADRPG